MHRFGRSLSFGALGAALALSVTARAQTVRYDLDSSADLLRDGFQQNANTGMPEFAAGIMRLRSTGYSEWDSQTTGHLRWLTAAAGATGWWFEFRMQLSSISGCPTFPPPEQSLSGGPGIWINDTRTLVKLQIVDGLAGISYPDITGVALDTSAYHVYRIGNLGARHVQVVIDGRVVVDQPVVKITGNGRVASLDFGDLGGCDASDTNWDYLSYDTVPPPPVAGDADGDGVPNVTDDCVLVANADQLDMDKDGAGDACDPCLLDPENDIDGDGLCGDVDPCPTDVRNDANHNGICDTMECATAHGPACPSICNCGMGGFISDPIYPSGGAGGRQTGSGTGGNGGTASGGAPIGNGGASGTGNAGSGLGGGGADGNSGVGASAGLADDTPSANAAPGNGASCGCALARREGDAGLALLLVAGLLGQRRAELRRSLRRSNR